MPMLLMSANCEFCTLFKPPFVILVSEIKSDLMKRIQNQTEEKKDYEPDDANAMTGK